MAVSEDSVVASLNELRQMANDRARRETEARSRVDDRGGWAQPRGYSGRRGPEAHLRVSEVRPMEGNGHENAAFSAAAGHSPTLMGGHAVAESQPQPGYGGYGYGYGYSHPVQAAAPDPYVEPVKQKSAAGAVFLTILLMGGAAAGAYWKLQQDWQATLRAKDAAILNLEESRNKAVEAAARADQQAKVLIADAEQKMKALAEKAAASAAAPATPAAAPAAPAPGKKAAAAIATKSSKADKSSRRGRRAAAAKKATARVERPAPPPPPAAEEPKPASAVPKIAGKKKINDDPLAGLKL
jgi:hypothetical protein